MCIWTLRKLKVSCIIAMKCEGGTISGMNQSTYWYDCNLLNVNVTDRSNNSVEIPSNQKFHIKTYPNEL